MSHVRSDGDISKREHLYKREQSLTLHTPSITRRTGHTHTHPPHRRLYSALVSIFLAACLFVIAHCGSPQLSGPSKGLSLRAAVDKERRRKGLAVTLSAGKAIEAQVKVKTFFCESHLQRALQEKRQRISSAAKCRRIRSNFKFECRFNTRVGAWTLL